MYEQKYPEVDDVVMVQVRVVCVPPEAGAGRIVRQQSSILHLQATADLLCCGCGEVEPAALLLCGLYARCCCHAPHHHI